VTNDVTICVAVATTGRPGPLERCLAALRSSEVQPGRVLVVDQGGDPGTKAVALAHDCEHLPYPSRGLGASRNAALDASAESVLAVTDDDCVPDRSWLGAILGAFDDDARLTAVTGPVLPLPPEGDRVAAVSSRTSTRRETFAGRAAPWRVGTGGNLAFRRSALGPLRFDERLGAGAPGRAGEDLDILDRILARGGRIRYEPGALVRHTRQTQARRRSSRYDYGHGVGAWLGLAARRRDPHAALHLARWLALRGRLALSGDAGEEARVLAGTLAGLGYGLRA
jgi:GT2 family glycosyltransferase